MRAGSRLIERYIVRAITPYLFLSLLLLTTILFTQQASRFGELLMGTRVPLGMVAELALSVLPNVLVFVDRNDNGVFDGVDTATSTASDGFYSILLQADETVRVRQTPPKKPSGVGLYVMKAGTGVLEAWASNASTLPGSPATSPTLAV